MAFQVNVLRVLGLVTDLYPAVREGRSVDDFYALRTDRASWMRVEESYPEHVLRSHDDNVILIYSNVAIPTGLITLDVVLRKEHENLHYFPTERYFPTEQYFPERAAPVPSEPLPLTFQINVLRVLGLVSDVLPYVHQRRRVLGHFALEVDVESWRMVKRTYPALIHRHSRKRIVLLNTLYHHTPPTGLIDVRIRAQKGRNNMWLVMPVDEYIPERTAVDYSDPPSLPPIPTSAEDNSRKRAHLVRELDEVRNKIRRLEAERDRLTQSGPAGDGPAGEN